MAGSFVGPGLAPLPHRGLARDDRQHEMRWVAGVVEDRLPGALPPRAGGLVLARVQVAIEAREVARRDLDADAMAGQEDVARGPEGDGKLRDVTCREEGGGGPRVAIAGANDAVSQVPSIPVGGHVDEL